MANMTVTLPEKVKDWIESHVRDGEFGSSGEYISDLVRRDHDRRLAELRQIAEEGLAGGISTRTTAEIFDEAVERARQNGTLRE